jgi:polysaccharide deacetylase family protein (PEP-CTERM system associated)
MSRTCMLSFDVEDWFHVERFRDVIPRDTWDTREPRVEAAVDRLLALLAERGARATFFVLGWVAMRCPALVRRIAAAGHEVACHGFHHEPLSVLAPQTFAADVTRAKGVLEALIDAPVVGYRAPTFSIEAWALPVLARLGFLYDSSYFPGPYRYAGDLGGRTDGRLIGRLPDGLWEVQIPSLPLFGRAVPWGGSGYFRVYPYRLFRRGVRHILATRREFVFYLHPWELDGGQPRIGRLRWRDRFRQYHGLDRTEAKLRRFLGDFAFEPLADGVRRRLAGARLERSAA